MTTIDNVRDAVQTLRAAGKKINSTTVREVLGNGGKRHILKHLRTIQALI